MRILLVEDDASIRAVAELALKRVGKHDVTIAENGRLALDTLEKNQSFDLILLDVMMPELDGFETCKFLKAHDHLKSIPVIFLTAKAQVHEIRQGISLGAIGYVIKPFDPMTLSQEVLSILESHGVKTGDTRAA